MYPATSFHNYYATLAEPANPYDQATKHADDPREQYQQAITKTVIHPSTRHSAKDRPNRKVNWAATLAPNQDKPKHIPTMTTEKCNAVRDQHHARLAATTQHRTSLQAKAIIDSGATGHYGSSEGEWIQTNTPSHKVVGLADGSPVAASVQATLPYHTLPLEARDGDIIPGLRNDLVSVKKLADAKLTTILHEHGAEVYPAKALTIIATTAPVLRGCRDKAGLWRVAAAQTTTTTHPLTKPSINTISDHPTPIKAITWHQHTKMEAVEQPLSANTVFDLPSIGQSIKWHHASLGFPAKDTLIKSINNGHFVTWPLLTQSNVSKHFPESDETIMGHTNQQRQGVRSTKPKLPQPNPTPEAVEPNNTEPTHAHHHGCIRANTHHLQYIMVVLHEDSNYAFEEPMKNKSDEEMQRAYSAIITRIKNANLTVKKHILDNECSAAMKQLITKTCKYELVPPGIHRRNKAEVTIKAFKQHLISVFAGLDPLFPMSQWDKLIPQVEITMNLLRQSKANPKVSAYEYVHGPYDYNRYPLAPIGCAVQKGDHGHHTHNQAGIWDLPLNITDATEFYQKQHKRSEYVRL